jgi:FtsZ-binding cell division protein ZapB
MKRILALAVASTITLAPAAFAEISEADFQLLREQLAAVSARLDELEAENAELRAAQKTSAAEIEMVETTVAQLPASGGNWSDRIRLGGDFRYRPAVTTRFRRTRRSAAAVPRNLSC